MEVTPEKLVMIVIHPPELFLLLTLLTERLSEKFCSGFLARLSVLQVVIDGYDIKRNVHCFYGILVMQPTRRGLKGGMKPMTDVGVSLSGDSGPPSLC